MTNVSGGYLSPPDFSLSQSSSTSTPDITDRVRSLSLAAAPTDSAAFTASSQPSQDIGPEVRPEPYDPRNETGPAHEYFTSDFQQKMRAAGRIAKEAVAAVEKLGVAMELDGEVEQLLEKAKEMSSFHSDVTRKIAILGDSGEGKSGSHRRFFSFMLFFD